MGERDIGPATASFVPLGGTDEIGASCHFLSIDGTGILLDAGADPELEGTASLPDLDLLRRRTDRWVDHVLVSHAHHDHLGSLPVVIRAFPHVMVHMTRATRDLADILLPASAKLQRRRLVEGSSSAQPLFDTEELGAYSYLYLTHELDSPFDATGIGGATRIEGRLFDAGHVLGSAGILLTARTPDGPRSLFYTGDTSLRPQTVLPGASYPEGPVDTLIMEATLGGDPDAERTTRRQEERRLGEALRETMDRGGCAVLPVFALGRGQEIIALLDRFRKSGVIGEDVPIYSAGMLRAIADIYDRTRFSTPRVDADFQVFGVEQKRLPRAHGGMRDALARPGIFVVGSGMMFERTLSNRLAQEVVEHERHAVLLVGFAREDSPAHRLMHAAGNGQASEVVLDALRGKQTVRCRVDRFRFSGHSHRRDLIGLVERLRPRRVIIVHGETRSRAWMADNIRFFHPEVDVCVPDQGQEVPLWPDSD
jgi:Cft2 family RNA processing exonuclease